MAKTSTEIYMLGPCQLSLDGSDMGYVEDVELSLEFEDFLASVAQYGSAPVKAWHLATKASVKFVMHQVTYAKYQKVMNGSSVITDGVDTALGFGSTAGAQLTPVELVLTPEQSATLGDMGKLTLWKVVPSENRSIKWNKEHQKLEVTVVALVNESKADGEKLGRFGDGAVSADTSAPTVSTYLPLDDATGVATSATVNATFNEALDEDTINAQSVMLFTGLEASGPQTPVAGTVTYDSATKKITFTPSSALSASTLYEFILTTAIKNASGVRFAGAKSSFTTA